jgi:cytochrome bd-type quinol oxidase subunit 2
VLHSPAYSWDAEAGLSFRLVSRARREKMVNAGCAIMGWAALQTVGYALGKLFAGVAIDWVSCWSPTKWWLNVQSGQCDAG